MSLTAQQLATLADLNSGRGPVWTAPVVASALPPTTLAGGSTEGLDVSGTTLTQVAVRLRLDPRRPAVTLQLAVDLGDTGREYEVDIESVNFLAQPTSPANALTCVLALVQEINASADHRAAALSSASTETRLRVWRLDSTAIADVTPAQNVTLVGRDAQDATIWIWGRSSTLDSWFLVGQSEGLEVTGNWMDAIRTSGLDALYVQVETDSADPLIYVSVGPCKGTGTA